MSDHRFVVWHLYFCSQRILRSEDCEAFNVTLWRLLLMSLLFFWFSWFVINICCFFGRPLLCLLRCKPLDSVFVMRFKIFVFFYAQGCSMALINFPSFHIFKMACISPLDSSLVFMLAYHFNKKYSVYRWNPRPEPSVVIQSYLIFKQSI